MSLNTGAALGVAYVSALIGLGISLGFNFAKAVKGPRGPNLLEVLRGVDRERVPEDVRNEAFHAIEDEERPQVGDWFAIWGGE